MGAEEIEQKHAVPEWRRLGRQAARQAGHLLITVTIVALIAIALGAIAAGLQAGRDEARSADLALVVAPAVPPAGLADHSFELYRRGYVRTLLLVGEGTVALRAQMAERGVPEAAIVEAPAAATSAELRRLSREARAGAATSALVVTAPEEQLRALKIVRDQGLRAYGAPPPTATVEPLGLVAASVRYWRYVLLGL